MTHEQLAEYIPTTTGWIEDDRLMYGIADKGVIYVNIGGLESHIFVKPAHRGQGVCRAMKKAVWKRYPQVVFQSLKTLEYYHNN